MSLVLLVISRDGGVPCVDAVLTTREVAKMLKDQGIKKWEDLQEAEFDNPLGDVWFPFLIHLLVYRCW